MTHPLPRSNSQSQLPNYGQGQSDNKKDVDKKKDGAPAQSDKNTGQGHSNNNKAAPKMKSKEEKKGKEPTESVLNDGRGGYGANFEAILFPEEQGGAKTSNTFERIFLNAKPSQVAQKFKNENESSSEDDVMSHQAKMPKSPRQQQSDNKEKTPTKKVPKLQLPKFGNALGSLTSDRREMTTSPRKTKRETHRNTQDSNSSMSHTAESGGTTAKNTTATTGEKVKLTDLLKKFPDQPVSSPQELAKIVIAAESNEGKIHLTKSKAETMFRSGAPTYQGKPLGESYRKPFMRSCFLTPNVITIVQEMQENYTAIKKTGNFVSKSLKEKAESIWEAGNKELNKVLNHKSVMEDFSVITKPLTNKINGADSNISTSTLPARFRHFLIELDREILRWHQETPDSPEKLSDTELRDVRRNALANYLGIYGPYATIKIAASEVKSENKILDNNNPYVLLESILSKSISETFDNFLSSVMDCTDDQYSNIEKRSNQEQEDIAKKIETRRMQSLNQSERISAQSTLPGHSQGSNWTTNTTTTTTTVTTTTTTSTKKSERVASDSVRKPKNDPRRSPAKLAAAAVNAVKESKKNKSKDNDPLPPTKPSVTSLQQVFRENTKVDGIEVFKEFIVPYVVSNLKQTKVVSLGKIMHEEFVKASAEYDVLIEQAKNEKKKSEKLGSLASESRKKELIKEADDLAKESQNCIATAEKIEKEAQDLVATIVNPVLDYFSPKNLQHILPEQLLDFLALCDKELTAWMKAESVGMTKDQMLEIRIRGLTGLLMNRGLAAMLNDELWTSKNPALSEQENRTISGNIQKEYLPVQVALNKGFNTKAKTDMTEFLGFLETRVEQAMDRSKVLEKDYLVARMQAGADGQVPVSPRKRVKPSQISKDKNSAVSALKGSVAAFLAGLGLDQNSRLFNELADFLVSEFNEGKITDPSDVELAQLTKLYIDDLRERGNMTQQRFTALAALENSILPLLPKTELANQTQQNPLTTGLATPSPSVTTTTALRETNQAYVSAFFDFYNLIGIDPDSYQMILQRVDDEFTENSVVATLDDVVKIGLAVFEGKMVQLRQAGDLRVHQLEVIIAELKQFS